jgi:hypothetical protein
MTSYLSFVPWFLFTGGPPAILVWLTWRWWRASPRIGVPARRSYPAIGIIVIVGLSGLFWIISSAWIYASGGAASYSPIFRWFARLGLLAAVIQGFFFIVTPPAILVWAIRRWWRTSPRIAAPAWRSYLAIAAIVLVGLSQLLRIVTGVWADVSGGGGFPSNPAFIWLLGFGFLAAPAGLLIGLFSKGTLRWPACGLSVLMTFLWILTIPWDM